MLIKQVFNNNVVLVDDDLKKREYILIGKGLGFQKKKGMKVDIDRVEKKFISDDASVKKRLIALAEEVDPDIFDATSEMIGRIEKELGQDLYKYIYLSLTDHIAFAIKRNKADKYDEDIKVLKIMKDILNIIRYYYKIDYDEDDLDYDRLVTHVRFFAKRVLLMKRLVDNNDDLLELVKIKYDRAYRCVEKINDYIMNNYSYEIGNDEKLYLILHIDRVTRKY